MAEQVGLANFKLQFTIQLEVLGEKEWKGHIGLHSQVFRSKAEGSKKFGDETKEVVQAPALSTDHTLFTLWYLWWCWGPKSLGGGSGFSFTTGSNESSTNTTNTYLDSKSSHKNSTSGNIFVCTVEMYCNVCTVQFVLRVEYCLVCTACPGQYVLQCAFTM